MKDSFAVLAGAWNERGTSGFVGNHGDKCCQKNSLSSWVQFCFWVFDICSIVVCLYSHKSYVPISNRCILIGWMDRNPFQIQFVESFKLWSQVWCWGAIDHLIWQPFEYVLFLMRYLNIPWLEWTHHTNPLWDLTIGDTWKFIGYFLVVSSPS